MLPKVNVADHRGRETAPLGVYVCARGILFISVVSEARMRFTKRIGFGVAVAVFLCLAMGSGPAFAAQTVQFTITSGTAPNGTYGVMGGVYTSPYTGEVGSGPLIPAICDDFSDEVTPVESWTANATNVASIGASTTNQVYFDQGKGAAQQTDYMVAATLAEEILNTTDETTKGYLSFALWEIFDATDASAALDSYDPTLYDQGKAQYYLGLAQAAVTNGITSEGLSTYLSSFSNVTIYSAVDSNGNVLTTKTRPQEFIVVSMPEPSSLALLGLDLLAVVGLVLLVRRRLASSAK